MTFEVTRYDPAHAATWDSFVRSSKNATFLHERSFMDYHADRFDDHSLMVTRNGKLFALMPANARDGELQSHGGLTYGGVLSDAKMSAADMLHVFEAIVAYGKGAGLRALSYKPVPPIYHSQPAQEDIYALFRCGADLTRVDVSATIPIPDRLPFSKSKKVGVRRAADGGVEVRESTDWAACWDLLGAVLAQRHDARPVHSLDEITLLAGRFDGRIRLFGAFDGDAMISAMVMFDFGQTVHVQYIASSDRGRELGGVDAIVNVLLEDVYGDRVWFDFGISTTDQGRVLNEGLAQQKEMFGARSTVYQQYRLAF